jgi:hypothetical protein
VQCKRRVAVNLQSAAADPPIPLPLRVAPCPRSIIPRLPCRRAAGLPRVSALFGFGNKEEKSEKELEREEQFRKQQEVLARRRSNSWQAEVVERRKEVSRYLRDPAYKKQVDDEKRARFKAKKEQEVGAGRGRHASLLGRRLLGRGPARGRKHAAPGRRLRPLCLLVAGEGEPGAQVWHHRAAGALWWVAPASCPCRQRVRLLTCHPPPPPQATPTTTRPNALTCE